MIKYYCKNILKRTKGLYCKKIKQYSPECLNCDAEVKERKPIKQYSKKRITVSNNTYNQVMQECGYKCALCGCTSGLQYHHILYRSEAKHIIDEASNGIMLCISCHQLVHSNKKKWQTELKEIKNYFDK